MAKILLAEDEKQIADMISFKLDTGGHHVIRAEDGNRQWHWPEAKNDASLLRFL